MMSNNFAGRWYILCKDSGECQIVTELPTQSNDEEGDAPTIEYWGPFESEGDAIAKRVGLIRTGKCKPKQ